LNRKKGGLFPWTNKQIDLLCVMGFREKLGGKAQSIVVLFGKNNI
jgi:hypothetical protein